MKQVILLTKSNGEKLVFGSIKAMLDNDNNPISISQQRFNQITKEKGWPVIHSDCKVERLPVHR